ncbi:MAG: thioredoxin domain-containing protein [Myxococcales bacterium]|nr:thioredoxin domain-containing protein [Myxococcales bacterium]
MSRLATPSWMLLALALLPGCRPSHAELQAVQAQLGEIQAQQQELSAQVQLLAQREAGRDDAERFERSELEEALIGVAGRVAKLEEQLEREPARGVRQVGPQAGRPDPAAVYKVEVGDAPIRGPQHALVTIVMWTDYQCPYCSRVQATLAELEKEYGRSVRFVHKHNPLGFHARAMPAALAAEAAGRQGKFWEMHDRLFGHQKELTDQNFRKWAKKLGLKVGRFERDLDDPELRARIERDQAQGNTLGARGTPAFFINGRFLSGAQPLESFRALIDEELARAQRLVDRGVPLREVYTVTIAEGRTES